MSRMGVFCSSGMVNKSHVGYVKREKQYIQARIHMPCFRTSLSVCCIVTAFINRDERELSWLFLKSQ